METSPHVEPIKPDGLAHQVLGVLIASVHFVRHQLAGADINPSKGELLASISPVEYLGIPDHPPIHDDTL